MQSKHCIQIKNVYQIWKEYQMLKYIMLKSRAFGTNMFQILMQSSCMGW